MKEVELEVNRLQKFEMEIVDIKVPSSLSSTLDDDECKKCNANDDDE